MKEFKLLIWLTQLGVSVAAPLTLCILGALWLRSRFDLGIWVLFAGIGLGLYLAVSGFRTSLNAMEQMGQHKSGDADPPPACFKDHQ